MSNYPPGVTGNERAIAGPRSERDETHEVGQCEKFEGVNIVQITKSGPYPEGTFTGPFKARIVRRAKGTTCTFEGGEVEGLTEDHTWFIWECPSCGHENGMEVEPPEPDYEYEREDW